MARREVKCEYDCARARADIHTLAHTRTDTRKCTHARTHSDNVRKKIILRKYGKKVFHISIKVSSENLFI